MDHRNRVKGRWRRELAVIEKLWLYALKSK